MRPLLGRGGLHCGNNYRRLCKSLSQLPLPLTQSTGTNGYGVAAPLQPAGSVGNKVRCQCQDKGDPLRYLLPLFIVAQLRRHFVENWLHHGQ